MKSKNRKYYLHRKLKKEATGAYLKSQKKTVYISGDEDITDTIRELQNEFGYSIQYEIPQSE